MKFHEAIRKLEVAQNNIDNVDEALDGVRKARKKAEGCRRLGDCGHSSWRIVDKLFEQAIDELERYKDELSAKIERIHQLKVQK